MEPYAIIRADWLKFPWPPRSLADRCKRAEDAKKPARINAPYKPALTRDSPATIERMRRAPIPVAARIVKYPKDEPMLSSGKLAKNMLEFESTPFAPVELSLQILGQVLEVLLVLDLVFHNFPYKVERDIVVRTFQFLEN